MSALRLLLVLLLALFLAPATTIAQEQGVRSAGDDILPLQVTERTLPNGLKVIVVPTGFPNIVSLQIPVQVGSRNEVEPGKSGFAHFFEHMMFRGTERYPPDRYGEVLKRAGARQNAYTTDDFTNYHTTFAKEALEQMLEVEADRFMHLEYSREDFMTEARAVLGEYNKNSANPISKLVEVQREAAYDRHTYKHTTMGFLSDIEDMPNQFEYSRVFFDRFYRPEYTTLIIAGDVTAEEVLPLVEKYWGAWERGSFRQEIPQEEAPSGPRYAHVSWESRTLPFVTVGFRGPGFDLSNAHQEAMAMINTLYFGPTSELYKRLVEQEQKVDQLFAFQPANVDPSLFTVGARLRSLDDAVYVRDQILLTLVQAREALIEQQRLEDAKSNARYGFARAMDNTETIASTLARFVRYDRSFNTINDVYSLYAELTPEDLRGAAQTYFADERMIVTTLSHEEMPAAIRELPSLTTMQVAVTADGAVNGDERSGAADQIETQAQRVTRDAPPRRAAAAAPADVSVTLQRTSLPQLNIKLLFTVGSAHDPRGKEGLSALAASMIANAGSRAMRIDEINRALYPAAGSFSAQADKEMTTFTGVIHRDNWQRFVDIALPQLIDPGFRDEDFQRLKARHMNALVQDLRNNNEEELGKERLQTNIFAGTAYAHPVLGTVAGLESITLDDVRQFVGRAYTQGALKLGLAGDVPEELVTRLRAELAALPASGAEALPKPEVSATRPTGMNVEIIEKDTRATAISFGHPIEVTRSHPDFAALWVARAWLGEHRSSVSHLFQRIREVRGMNYGNYAYIEAFPRGMFQFFPDPNIARQSQIFEVWIRPVEPQNAHMALRIAVHELDQLHRNGLSEQDFEDVRDYLMKNVFVMTATQNQQLGYALDSEWYGTGEFTEYMRERLAKLTREDVNRAIRTHLDPENLSVVIITRDAEALKQALVSDAPSSITYDAEKPAELLEEDKVIGNRKLGIREENVRVTPVAEVWTK